MTTPADNTPLQIIRDAYFEAKLTARGQMPSTEQLSDGMRKLRDLISIIEIKTSARLWALSDQSILLVADQAAYTLMPGGSVDMTRPLTVEKDAYWLSSTSQRRPVRVLSWNEHLSLGSPTTSGSISQIFVNRLYDRLEIQCWPTPSATEALGTLHVLLRTQITKPLELDETLQFPVEWRLALVWGLADEFASGQTAEIVQRCMAKAMSYLDILEGFDTENTGLRFELDLEPQSFSYGRFV